jgi:hypothetical protein
MPKKLSPKVFISYSWTSSEHVDFVLRLAEKLMSDGVNVILDKWELKEGQDKYVFMESMVSNSSIKKVLVVSDKRYAEKANLRRGGVGTESQIISDEIYNKVKQEKFIPIVTEFDEKGEPYLPVFMKSRIYINLSNSETFNAEYEKLLRSIYNKPTFPKPSLGTPPLYISSENPQTIVTLHEFQEFKDSIKQEKSYSLATSQKYLEKFVSAFEMLKINTDFNPIDEEIIHSIENFKPYRNQFVEYLDLVCNYGNSFKYFDQIFNFIEKVLSYCEPSPELSSYSETWYDNYRFFIYELFLYLITILTKYEQYDAINLFVRENYYVENRWKKINNEFTYLDPYLRSLDEYRKQRLKSNLISITADLIKDRCDIPLISIESIIQTDFLLLIRSIIDDKFSRVWYPRTLIYRTYYERPFELFIRAESPRNMQKLCAILNVMSISELFTKFSEGYKTHHLDNWYPSSLWPVDYTNLMNLNNLQRLYVTEKKA